MNERRDGGVEGYIRRRGNDTGEGGIRDKMIPRLVDSLERVVSHATNGSYADKSWIDRECRFRRSCDTHPSEWTKR